MHQPNLRADIATFPSHDCMGDAFPLLANSSPQIQHAICDNNGELDME